MALTLTTTVEIVRLAGEGASTAITASGALVTTIGEDAEGEFCSDTRRDWIADYANVSARIKKKVSKAVASKAAMQIVAYSGKNYFSRLEQETLLDVLSDWYDQGVALLSKLDHNDIRGVDD